MTAGLPGVCAGCLLVLLAACSETLEERADYDVIISGGLVYDGSGGPARPLSIGIRGEIIVSTAVAAGASARQHIDAAGFAVMPGFIDPHTHALNDLLTIPRNVNANYLTQGVTTVFVGNDGAGLEDPEATLGALTNQGIGTNVAFYVGHNRIRRAVMGLANRTPTANELAAMLQLVDEGMERGALGLSTGLYYPPGSYAGTDEVVALARVAARHGGVYDSHIRDESSYSVGLSQAVEEMIAIARAAQIPGHIAHIKALGRDVWGQAEAISARIEAARAAGLAITADQYPYAASGTSLAAALIPAWVRADSSEAMLERLADLEARDAILDAMRANLARRGGAERLLITDAESPWRGLRLTEIAEQLELEPVLAAIEVVRAGDPDVASFNMQRSDMQTFATQPWVMTGSDGSSGHPRKYATYPATYRDMVVRNGWLSTQRFVQRSTGRVADTFGLCDRGYIATGRKADIIVVDLDSYAPRATFDHPERFSAGVVHVLVNGRLALSEGELSADLHGTVIRRQDLECQASTAS